MEGPSLETALVSLPDVTRRRVIEWVNQTDTRYRSLFVKWLSDPRIVEATFDLLGKAEGHFNRVAVQPLQLLEADALPEQFVKAAVDSNGTIAALSAATEAKDPYTQGHTVRVAELAVIIAQKCSCLSSRSR